MTEHIMKAFDSDLQGLARMIAEMGGMAEKQIGGKRHLAGQRGQIRDAHANQKSSDDDGPSKLH